jgi:hypothetical protein
MRAEHSRTRRRPWGLLVVLAAGCRLTQPDPDPVAFNTHIRPVLSENCFPCHGPDRAKAEAGLSLHTLAFATAPRTNGGPALVPGDRRASLVWQRINDAGDPMPPEQSHKSLTAEEIEQVGRWIDAGAVYQRHWAYEPPAPVAVPAPRRTDWARTDIDRFVLARLERAQLAPQPDADPLTLVRRLHLDLTGLPPTPEEAAAFAADPSPAAYERRVDDLLARPAYGEHLAAWWLDLVRYGDTVGFHGDQPRSMWPYRSWVIGALNANQPFDQFSTWQLAGDLLADAEPDPARREQMRIASAYNRLPMETAEGGAQAAEYEIIYDADRVQNLGEVWLASSLNCARCHDHKYDPFTQRDYYAMAAFFADVDQPIVSDQSKNEHWLPYRFVPQDEAQRAEVEAVEKTYRALLAAHPDAPDLENSLANRYPYRQPKEPWEKEFATVFEQRRQLGRRVPTVSITRRRPQPREIHLLPRGNWMDRSGPVLPPAYPDFLAAGGPGGTGRLTRLDLAAWLFRPEHPLTARVTVNRLWARFFGAGLSRNLLDAGSQGEPPSHPDLLDHLALSFRASGWDLKALIRQFVLSSTYRQGGAVTEAARLRDPENRLLSRQAPVRLPMETIRDQALAAAGLYRERVGGPSVFPPQPAGHWDPLNFPRRSYPVSPGDDRYRRSVYTWVQRAFPHPVMVTFDAPSRETCVAQRLNANTPLQALVLLNEPGFVACAQQLARRVTAAAAADDAARLDQAFRLVLVRPPRPPERQLLLDLLARQRAHFAALPAEAARLAPASGDAPATIELAAWTSVSRALLNLHETITRY